MHNDKKYNHAYSIAFEVNSANEKEASDDEILDALKELIKHLKKNREEINAKCGRPFDTVSN